MGENLGSVDYPQKLIGEELQLDVFDGADPADTGTRRWWYRSDLSVNNSDAVIRVNDNGNIVDVPVYEQSTTVEAGIDTSFGVVAPGLSEPAFVPMTDPADAAFDFGRVEQPGGSELALHNRTAPASAIPDSGGTHQWDTDSGSGTTLADSIGSLNGSITGASWVSGAGAGGYHLDYDGEGDRTVLSGGASEFTHFTDAGTGTFFAWVNFDSISGDHPIFGSTFTSDEVGLVHLVRDGDLEIQVFDGGGGGSGSITTTSASFDPGANTWAPVAFTMDESDIRLFAGDPLSQLNSATINGSTASNWTNDPYFGYEPLTGAYADMSIDIPWTDDVARSQSELQSFVDDTSVLYP